MKHKTIIKIVIPTTSGFHNFAFFTLIFGMVQFWVAASSAAWGWQNSQSGATIPKSFGFENATPCETTTNVTRNLTYLNHA